MGAEGIRKNTTQLPDPNEALRRCEERLKSVLELSSDWYWEQDENLRFTQFSGRNFGEIGIESVTVIGKTRWEIPGADVGAAERASVQAKMDAHEPFRALEYRHTGPDGKVRHISASGSPAFDESGAFKGYRGVATDITERKRAEQLLLLEHAVTRSLAEAESASAAVVAAISAVCQNDNWESGGYWHVDQEAGVLRTSEYWCAPHATTEGFFQESRKLTFRPGVGMVGHVWQSAQPLWVADANKDRHVFQTTLVRETGMGSVCLFPVMSEAKVIGVLAFVSCEIREPDKRLLAAVRVIGNQIGQIVQRKLAEAALRVSEARFRSLTQLSSDSYWELDEQHRFTLFVGTGSHSADSQTIRLIGKKSWEQDCVNMSADDWAAHIAILEAHAPFHELELCRLGDSGRKFWTDVSGEPVFDASGSFKGYRGVGKDITARKQSEERIQHLANHDALTSLPNRTMFGEVLNIAFQNARRYRRNFALLFIDLDRFKVINDTLGHEAGDRLLQEMGRRLVQTVRASDVVARLGGDEFVVLVQEVSEEQQVETVARKILSALAKPMLIRGQECRVTASIGICMYPSHAQDERSLMKNADNAMYRAKEEGKNTYKFYSKV